VIDTLLRAFRGTARSPVRTVLVVLLLAAGLSFALTSLALAFAADDELNKIKQTTGVEAGVSVNPDQFQSAIQAEFDRSQRENVPFDSNRIGQVVQLYLADPAATQTGDPATALLDVRASGASQPAANPLLGIVGPIMGGMMIFFAFYTGAATAQSILEEEEEQTLPRLFTTPTPQAVILTGKFLAVFLTVLVQVVVLLVAARLIFRIEWGELPSVALVATGTVLIASSFGVFFMSLLKSTKQGGAIFGGVLTVTGMIGMISIFAQGAPAAQQLGSTVSLLMPQGWAVRGLVQAMNGLPVADVLLNTLVMLAWSAAFFTAGVLRFNRRYA